MNFISSLSPESKHLNTNNFLHFTHKVKLIRTSPISTSVMPGRLTN